MHTIYRRIVISRSISFLKSRVLSKRNMASNTEEENNETLEEKFEQLVTMETVVAADNKGIDYDKLISKLDRYLRKFTTIYDA